MGILAWIVFGLIAGAIAKLLMPGRDPGGFIITILLGIVGAVVGGFIGNAIGLGSVTGFDIRSFIVAVLGIGRSSDRVSRAAAVTRREGDSCLRRRPAGGGRRRSPCRREHGWRRRR